MEWILVLAVLAFLVYRHTQKKAVKRKNALNVRAMDVDESPDIRVYATLSGMPERKVVETINKDGIPEFKFRFHANLGFETAAEALCRHRTENFIPRPNGNKEPIIEPGGIWFAVSEWDDPDRTWNHENDQFKYIGGIQVYIGLLLKVRGIYEDATLTPAQKKIEIEKICLGNKDVYTVKHVFSPPWESLLVPVLSTGDGIGPHRVGILEAAGIKTIDDIRSRTDGQLLEIKGIGKAAVSALRNLAAQWTYDTSTEVIEKDSEYRQALSIGSSHTEPTPA
ncbi:helix-hairpin-helix domain-containing protein [Alcaligenes faecalis]|uniref:helix-hairpin-helix domain-containing protein n=1 Tax=Alcaligenes faecalis TaxID=511 RepID=UPI0012932182|nr:helix-hairpin-helix domain-containing protein [Alcaligenes faecalis]QFY77823.1 helix-hairpin-helix domain-containing protein [Alcaligenes faecalis]